MIKLWSGLRSGSRRRWLTLIIAAAVAGLLLGNRGFRRLVSNTLELRRLRRELTTLQMEETSLRERIRNAKSSDYALETAARRELGYLKAGEVEYRFPPPKKD